MASPFTSTLLCKCSFHVFTHPLRAAVPWQEVGGHCSTVGTCVLPEQLRISNGSAEKHEKIFLVTDEA